MQQTYQCPNCGNPVAFGLRFCGNCGTFLNWAPQQANYYQLGPPQKKERRVGLFAVIGLMAIVVVIGVLISQGIFTSDPSLKVPVTSAASMPQPLTTPMVLAPGIYADPGQTIDTITPSLQWNTVSGAEYYSLILSKFPYGPGNIVYTPAQLAGTSLILPDNVLEYGQRYRWAIEAHNTGSSRISNALYFQTPQHPPSSQPASPSASIPAVRPPATPPIPPPVSFPPRTPSPPRWAPI